MKTIKLLTTICLLVCWANLQAQNVDVKFQAMGGKGDQREAKRIYISDLAVKQLLQKKGTAKAGGGIGGNMAYAHMTVNFGGVDPSAYQTMLTEVYDELCKKLTSLGYEVVGGDEAKAKVSKGAQVVNTVGEPSKDMYLGLITTIHPKDRVITYPANIITAGLFYPKVAKDLDAVVLAFNFAVDYINYDSNGGAFASKAKIQAAPNLVVSGSMNAAVAKGGGVATVKPVRAEDDWIGPEGIYQTSKSSLPQLFGMGASSSSSKYTIDINEQKYLAHVKQFVLAAANASIDAWREGIK
ncbi:MAG: hypothetical protein K0S09_3050 [Sphingobacteriaceae bacterium]|jgi:hypothetical protein|nr:hypothetical protein [Sphingobacteriaceae bacterium]